MGNVTFVPDAWAEKEIATVREKEKEQKMEIKNKEECGDSRPRLSAGQRPASPHCQALFLISDSTKASQVSWLRPCR